MRLLVAQDLFHAREGPLYLGGHAGMHRFGAEMDGVEEAQRSIEGQARMRTQDRIWQGEHPMMDGACFSTEPEVRSSLLHQGSSKVEVRRGQRVCNGLPPLALRLIPACYTLMQERHQFWLRSMQSSTQGLTKQIMIAVPPPLLIERHHKEVGSLYLLQHLLARRLA